MAGMFRRAGVHDSIQRRCLTCTNIGDCVRTEVVGSRCRLRSSSAKTPAELRMQSWRCSAVDFLGPGEPGHRCSGKRGFHSDRMPARPIVALEAVENAGILDAWVRSRRAERQLFATMRKPRIRSARAPHRTPRHALPRAIDTMMSRLGKASRDR